MAGEVKNPWVEARRQKAQEKKNNWHRHTADPVRRAFRKAVEVALRDGELTQEPCTWRDRGKLCGKMPTEAHHLSYEPGHELDIRWLCDHHHRIATQAQIKAKKAASASQGRSRGGPGVVVVGTKESGSGGALGALKRDPRRPLP